MNILPGAPATCGSCGRRISSAASLRAGRGSGCRAKLRAAARTTDLSAFKPEQVEKARELVEQNAVVPSSRPGLYSAVSAGGTLVYLTDAIGQTCTCRAGENGRRCYHLASALVLEAAAPARRAA